MKPSKREKPIERKPYARPTIQRVELHPEESLAAGCKTVSTGGSLPGSCTLPSDCFVSGS